MLSSRHGVQVFKVLGCPEGVGLQPFTDWPRPACSTWKTIAMCTSWPTGRQPSGLCVPRSQVCRSVFSTCLSSSAGHLRRPAPVHFRCRLCGQTGSCCAWALLCIAGTCTGGYNHCLRFDLCLACSCCIALPDPVLSCPAEGNTRLGACAWSVQLAPAALYLARPLPDAFKPCPPLPADEEALRTAFINVDKEGKGDITEIQFEEALRQAGVELVRHQGVSLYRRLAGHAGTAAVRVEHFLQVGCYSVLWQHLAELGWWQAVGSQGGALAAPESGLLPASCPVMHHSDGFSKMFVLQWTWMLSFGSWPDAAEGSGLVSNPHETSGSG